MDFLFFDNTYTKITRYLQHVAKYYKENGKGITILHNNKTTAIDIANKFIEDVSPSPVFIVAQVETSHFEKPKITFLFVNNAEEIEEMLKRLQLKLYLWSSPKFLYFVLCKELENMTALKASAETLWKNSILNFVMIYHHKKKVRAVEYNPFFKKFIKLNFPNVTFSNKLRNMAGYPLKVTLFNDPPRIVNLSGVFHGTDVRNLHYIIEMFNASLEIKVPEGNDTDTYFRGYVLDQVYHRTDFGMVSSFVYILDNITLRMTYPRKMDDVVVVVPTPQRVPQYRYLSLVFSENLWLATLVSLVIVCLTKYYTDKTSNNFTNSALEVYAILLAAPVNNKSTTMGVSTLFILWCYACMVLNVAFQCCLTSIIITPKYEKQIDSLHDLKQAKMEILINRWHRLSAGQDKALNACMTTETEANIIEMMMKGYTDKAYAVQLSVAEEIVSKEFDNNFPKYHIMQEHLVPGFTAYLFPAVSPYVEEINRFLLLDQQFGISRFNSSKVTFGTRVHPSAEPVPLNLGHLQTVFYILIVGGILSISAFIYEITRNKLSVCGRK